MTAFSLTYRDAIDHLVDWTSASTPGSGQRDIRRAILSAYREFTEERDWIFYRQHYRLFLQAPYSTGTITYDHAGGSVFDERELLLATGTWPSWIVGASVRIGNVVYDIVDQGTGGNTAYVQIDSNLNPGADIASGTSYTAFKSRYTLPENFKNASRWYTEGNWFNGTYVNPEEWLALERFAEGSGDVLYWTIMSDPLNSGRLAIHFYPSPSAARTLDTVMIRRARNLTVSGYDADHFKGKVTTSASSATVSGSGTNFTSAMVGAKIRISGNSSVPTGLSGENLYVVEKTIKSVESTTSLTVDSNISTTYTNVGYAISDPVDIHPTHENAFLRCCEKQLVTMRPDSQKMVQQVIATYEYELRKAQAAEAPARQPKVVGGRKFIGRRLADFPDSGYV